MKIASLVFGEYRTFDTVVKTWNVLNYDNIDFYFSTWDSSSEYSEKLNIKKEFEVTKNMILNHIPSATIKLDSMKTWKDGSINNFYWPNHYQWKELYKMVTESNTTYDIIILHRMDCYLYIHDLLNILKNIRKNTIYNLIPMHKNPSDKWWTADTFFIAQGSTMLEFLKNMPDYMEDSHVELAEYLIKSPISVSSYEYNIFSNIVRDNMKYIFDDYFKQNPNRPLFKDMYFKYLIDVFEKNLHGRLEEQYK